MSPEQLPFEVVGAQRHVLAESPAWSHAHRCLWWVDIRAPMLFRWHPDSGNIDAWPLPQVAGAVVCALGQRVVVALKDSLHLFDPADAGLTHLATLEQHLPHNRLNEAKVDRQGRLWCGSMWDFGAGTSGSLYRMGHDLEVRQVRTNVTIANGIAFAPDDRTMYFVDTRTGWIECAPFDADAGMPGAWNRLVAPDAAPGRPDGNAIDSEGCIWSARFAGGCIARFTPAGRLDRLIAVPASQPTSCAFGGADLRTLFVTTATQRMTPAALAAEPLAGAVLAFAPGAQGLPEPAFGV